MKRRYRDRLYRRACSELTQHVNQLRSQFWNWKKPAIIVIVIALVGLFVGVSSVRWYVAERRVAAVEQRAALASTQAQTQNKKSPSIYAISESAGRASIHLQAISAYESRKASDLAALPPAGLPFTTERLALLNKLADEGNARAACALAQETAKCAFHPVMIDKELRFREQRLQSLRREGKSDPELLEAIDGSRRLLNEFRAHCKDFNLLDAEPAWRNLLRSALMGYKPAMERFVMMPLFDPTDVSANIDAYSAQLSYYGPMLDAVAQYGHEFFMATASREYGGSPMRMSVFGISVPMSNIEPDPVRALAFAYASVDLHLRRYTGVSAQAEAQQLNLAQQLSRYRDRVASLEAQYAADQRRWARELANQMAANWTPETTAPPKSLPESSEQDIFKEFDVMCRE
jgi:hypothetical protein